jgi:mannose-6-phosphate isomerase-like protein (cupin superfamily)
MRFLTPEREFELKELIAEKEKEVKEILPIPLGSTDLTTHILVLIRTQEPPHYHKDHDLTVILLKGKGEIYLEGKRMNMREGDSVFIPKGAVHYYTNTALVSALLAIFTPSYDGKDSIKVKEVK